MVEVFGRLVTVSWIGVTDRERRFLRSMAASLNRRDLGRAVAALAAMCAYLEGREVKP